MKTLVQGSNPTPTWSFWTSIAGSPNFSWGAMRSEKTNSFHALFTTDWRKISPSASRFILKSSFAKAPVEMTIWGKEPPTPLPPGHFGTSIAGSPNFLISAKWRFEGKATTQVISNKHCRIPKLFMRCHARWENLLLFNHNEHGGRFLHPHD